MEPRAEIAYTPGKWPPVQEPITRGALYWLVRDWDFFCSAFGSFGLSREEWSRLSVKSLEALLTSKKFRVICNKKGRRGLSIRLPDSLLDFVARKGGVEFVRELIRREASAELTLAELEGWSVIEVRERGSLWQRSAREFLATSNDAKGKPTEPGPGAKPYRKDWAAWGAWEKANPDQALKPRNR